jgi:hypothetical protein
MFSRRFGNNPLLLGLLIGLVFGAANLVFTWLAPLKDDTPGVLLVAWGAMFFLWAFASFRAARRHGKLRSGVATGLIVAFATICVFAVLNFVRFLVFLYDLTGRADWQSMMAQFRASGYTSLRTFVTVVSIKMAPLLIGIGSVIGAVMGFVGGALGLLSLEWRPRLPDITLQPTSRA